MMGRAMSTENIQIQSKSQDQSPWKNRVAQGYIVGQMEKRMALFAKIISPEESSPMMMEERHAIKLAPFLFRSQVYFFFFFQGVSSARAFLTNQPTKEVSPK